MIEYLICKVGTHPQYPYKIKRNKKKSGTIISVGEKIKIQSINGIWIDAIVDKVKGDVPYLSLM